nr:MFS transporter [Acetobacter senegalensis]
METSTPVTAKRRSGHRRWFVCSQLALIIMVNYLDRGNLGVVLPQIQKEFALSNSQLGLVMSAFQWTYAFANVAMGFAVDFIGPRWLILIAGMGWTICAASTGIAQGLLGLVAARALLGLMESPMFPAGIRIVTTWFPDRERAVAISFYEIATSTGNLLAPLLAAILAQLFGWRVMFLTIAALTIPLLGFWAFFYREPEADPKLSRREYDYIQSGISQSGMGRRPGITQWLFLLTQWRTWIMITGGMSLAGTQSFLLWLPNYLQLVQHFSLLEVGKTLSVFGLFHIAGIILGSFLSDRLVRRNVPVLRARTLVLSAGAFCGGIMLAFVALTSSLPPLLVLVSSGYFFLGIGVTSWWALVPVAAPRAELVASLGSLQNGGLFLGMALSPLLSGWLLDHGYGYGVLMVFSSAFGAMAAVLYGYVLPRYADKIQS